MGKTRLRGPKSQLVQEPGLLVARQGSVLAVGRLQINLCSHPSPAMTLNKVLLDLQFLICGWQTEFPWQVG